ncbi:hypothetical protein [Bradyrhizobium sp. Arg816]|uniref:hypothetical protein n=1 Tax=Bradyrhizobium sp. Arg816 TaxID=2998491 RepID=UPI00249EC51C|nr:hypothetical protein [Bradyrhizobium sp. Arg816]MDI3562433.1 hypothetical protein [Bradyrhizobium sp. Arg816]
MPHSKSSQGPRFSEMLASKSKAVAKAAEVAINKVNIDATIASEPLEQNPSPDQSATNPSKNPEKSGPDKIIDFYNAEQAAKKAVYAAANTMLNSLDGCRITPEKPAAQPLYDPIDVIQETINFYITTSGNLTPSWKLVRITAPTASPFLSGTIKNTDTIIITMGRPLIQDGTVVASAPMNNSQQAALLGQAINSRLVP